MILKKKELLIILADNAKKIRMTPKDLFLTSVSSSSPSFHNPTDLEF